MKPKVTLWLFSAFRGAYPGLLPKTNLKSLLANCIYFKYTFYDVIYREVHRNELTLKMSEKTVVMEIIR